MDVKKAIVLGGTKGLGAAIASQSQKRGIATVVYGSSVGQEGEDHLPAEVTRRQVDLESAESVAAADLGHGDVDYFFWVAGVFLQKRLVDTTHFELDRMTEIHFTNPLKFVQRLQQLQKRPYHFITVASCSSWRLRSDETVYCSLKAAQATFARSFAVELTRDLPGSKVLLINPGGLKTPNFWKEKPTQDLSDFLDPDLVASIIWDEISGQKKPFHEVQILRRKPAIPGSAPIVEYGPKLPEFPE
jgi:NAD(P)-dependent dehydrogenase (short-subunit alcohol dehydrogenase family)